MIRIDRPRVALLSPKQREICEATAPIRGFVGGRGSGKTVVGAFTILEQARNGEDCMCVSPNYPMLAETTWPTFRDLSRQTGQYIKGVQSPLPRVTFRTQDGGTAELIFRSGDQPDSLRGPNKRIVWIDEASLQQRAAFDISLATLRFHGLDDCFMLLTFTPRGKQHWTFETFYDQVSSDRRIARQNTFLVQSHTSENPFLPEGFVDLIKGQYTTLLAQQELAGEFIDLQGFMFQRGWFSVVEDPPRASRFVRYWDKAATEGAGTFTVGVLMARSDNGIFYVVDVQRGQWSPFERDNVIKQTAAMDHARYGHVVIYLEQEPGSGGKESAQQSIRMLARYPVYSDKVQGVRHRMSDGVKVPGQGKIDRAGPFAAQCEAGNVRLCDRGWLQEYLDELAAFPESNYSDQVNASSGAFNKLAAHAKMDTAPPEAMGHQKPDPSRHGVQWQRSGTGKTKRQNGNGRQVPRGRIR